ncbi:MAG TPA: ABC transporter permease [Nitrospiraceae bacterium]|jgi:ABC-type polysaccharide/polyol phosphate export permease|nr:ABC transporter permease [Nitrospiraceae bacterium]
MEAPTDEERQTLWETFHEIIYELLQYRDLLFQLTLRDIRIRYKQAVMGVGWAIFMPMLIVAAGFVVRYAIAHMAKSELNWGDFAAMGIKALPWAFFVGAIGFATTSLTSNINLVTKIYFPRAVLPLSAVLAQAFDTAIGAAAIAALLFFLEIRFSLQTLWAIPLLVLLFLFTVGMAFFVSCANLFFRDVKYIVQVLLTFGIFFTPVFYEPSNFGPWGCHLMMLNPLAPLLEGSRLAIVEHHNLFHSIVLTSSGGLPIIAWHPAYLVYAACWAVVGCLGAWLLFHKLQFLYAEYI